MSDTIEVEAQPTQALAIRQEAGAVEAGTAKNAPVTAEQAKVDAVAALTMSAYQKAATLELTAEEAAALQADFPDEAFLPGAAGKEHLIYIEHAHLRDRFNAVFGMGKWAIVPRNRWAEPFKTQRGDEGSRVYVEAMLVVRGCFVGEAVGAMEYYPHNGSQNYGDAVEGAKTAAFRRCAKEFGVGLQAWKKEFCDGWWARKRGGRDFSKRPPSTIRTHPEEEPEPPGGWQGAKAPQSKRPSNLPTPPPPTPPAPATAQSEPVKTTPAFRLSMLNHLGANAGGGNRQITQEYFEKVKWLLPGEPLDTIQLRYVPINKEQMQKLKECIARFGNGDRLEKPYEPNYAAAPPGVPEPTTPASVLPKVIAEANGKAKDPLWWRNVIISLPRKGMKRDEYLKHPDTIGSLYDLRHGSDDESQGARQRLWGMVQWKPEAREFKGKVYQPTDADLKCYDALQAFAAWFRANHPDEKL